MSSGLAWLFMLLLLVGGLLAISGLIVYKMPSARPLVAALTPFQSLIGIAMIVVSIVVMFKVGPKNLFRNWGELTDLSVFVGVFIGILLGAVFGMVQIAKLAAGGNQERALEMIGKLVPFQLIMGLIALAAALIMLLARIGILKFVENVPNM